MATLQQTLRGLPQADDQLTRGPGGSLQRTTLQQATQKAGLGAAPITPMGAQVIGADAQAAKMAGTPQQMKAALQQAAELPTLETALRQKQYGRALTAQEAAGMQKSTDMQKLGGLGDRVQDMVTAESKKLIGLTPTEGATTPGVALGTAAEYKETKITPEIATKLQQLQAATPGSDQYNSLLVDVNAAFNRTTADTALTAAELQSLYQTAAEAIGAGAAGAVIDPDKVKAMDFIPQLGHTAESLSALLGITPEELQGYSLAKLQDKVNQVTSEEFTRTKQLEQQAVSPLAGAAERGLAREAARELSTTGIRATEADMQRLSDEVASATLVSFPPGTPKRPIDQALANDEISAIVKEVVDSPADSQIRKDMKAQSPDFYAFIERNEAAIKAAASTLDTGTTKFKQLQDENKQIIRDSFGGIDLDPTVQEALVPGSTGLHDKAIVPADSTVLTHLQNKTPDERTNFATQVGTVAKLRPTVASEISSLTPKQLSILNIEGNGANWKSYKSVLQNNVDMAKLDPTDTSGILSHYSTNITSPEQVNADLELNNTMTNLGFGTPTYTTGTLPITDGKVDTSKLKDNFLTNNPVPTVADAAAGTIKQAPFNYTSPNQFGSNTPQGKVLSVFSDWGKSGKIPTMSELYDRLASLPRDVQGNTSVNLNDLEQSGTLNKWGITKEEYINYAMGEALKSISALKIDPNEIAESLKNIDLTPRGGGTPAPTVGSTLQEVAKINAAPYTGQIAAAGRLSRAKI